MDYALAILTHGDSRYLNQTYESFIDKVKPRPSRILVYCDGPGEPDAWRRAAGAEHYFDSEQRGFCKATGRLWRWTSETDQPYVFYLEHDFVFLRPVDLTELAYVLDDDAGLAQMQLMRTPVNAEEIAAGGLFESRRADYTPRTWEPLTSEYDPEKNRSWLEHRAYFTTNPSLMGTEFMAANPWPDDDQPECEGRFGIDLVERGYRFGVWGSGEPWCEHIGVRTGIGY